VSDTYNNRPPKDYSVVISGTGSCSGVEATFKVQDSGAIGAFLSDQFAVAAEGTDSPKLNVTLLSDTGAELFTKPFTCKPTPPACVNDPNDPPDPPGCVETLQ
jgi:hypothetical protein